MKIDFVISVFDNGGAERVMAILANHFVSQGHHVNLISFNKGDAYEINPKINRVKLHSGKIKNHKIRALLNLLNYYKLKSNRPDLLISFNTLNNLNSIIVAKLRGIKIIVSEHNNHLYSENPKKLTYLTKTFFYKFANHVTVLTNYDLDFYKKNNINVSVLPNPCTFAPNEENGHSREKTILAVGSLNRYLHKGFDNLIEIVEPILNKYPDWTLKIIGGGEKGKTFLESLIQKKGLTEQIILTGLQNNVGQYMKEGAIFVLPSRFEGLPMVLLEAMSQGMACIAYDCTTGPSDIIENEVNGVLIPDQNIIKMQEGLTRLIENNELRNTLGNEALKSLDRFSVETIANKWHDLFETIKS